MSMCDTRCKKEGGRIDGQCPVYNMADGRAFTDYRNRCERNNSIVGGTGIMDSYTYRQYLQHNAMQIIEKERNERYEQQVCKPCYRHDEDGTMLPEQTKFKCNELTCIMGEHDDAGLGTGRDYTVNTKNPLLTAEEPAGNQTGFFSWFS